MGKRVLDLPSVTTLLGTDVLYAVRPTEALISNYDKKITWADLLAQISTGSGYLPLTFASTQTLTYTGQGTFVFSAGGGIFATHSGTNTQMGLQSASGLINYSNSTSGGSGNLVFTSVTAPRTWTLPDASGTIALTSTLGDYIKRDGTTTTTASIPFAQGISVTGTNADSSAIRIPDGSWIRPQTAGQDIYITRGANPSSVNGVLQLNSGGIVLSHGDGTNQLDRLDLGTANTRLAAYSATGVLLDFLQLGNNNIALVTDAGVGLNATSTMMSMFGSTFLLSASAGDGAYGATGSHKWDSGIVGSTAKYQFNGSAHIASTLRIGSIPTGTQVGLVGYDSNGNLIQGSAGSFVTLSGHNDLTTPWSIGDASTWATSSAGIQIDPVGSYGLYLKGNAIIEQAVSQALTLYRPVTSGDICLNFDAQDSLGAQSNYAQVCGVVVSNTAGAVAGGLDLKVAIAGVSTPLLQLRQAGSTLTGGLTASGSLSISTNSSDTGFFSTNNQFSVGGIFVGRSSRGTVASPTALQAGDALLFLGGQGYGATGYSSISRALMQFKTSENWTDTAQGSLISFATTPNGTTTRTERGRIENDGVLTWLNRIDTTASTTTSAGLRIPHGTAPTSPVNGDIWTTTTAVLARINGTTRTFGLLGVANDWATIQTMRGVAVTGQTNTPTGTTYTWTLTSGNQLDITLTSSTGDVTITTASPSAGAYSILSATGHGTLARNLIITQSGVTFIMTGKTSGNSITLDSIPATKRACYILYWITTTKCFIDRVTLEA